MKLRIPELPLLRRELTELSNRRRTYIVRVLGACILLFFVFLAYQRAMTEREMLASNFGGFVGPTTYLGIGGAVFSEITPQLFYSIQLLLPAFCCAAVTSEKENNTIGTLLITKLSPGTIVLEKLGSRIIPMLTILLLAFPVLAHVHSLGGVDTDLLTGTIWLLLAECVLIAGISLMFSCWFATTTAAFIWSYAAIGAMLVFSMSLRGTAILPSAIWADVFHNGDLDVSMVQLRLMQNMGMAPAPGTGQQEMLLPIIIARSIPALFLATLTLFAARILVVRRAFISQSSVLLKIFRRIDSFFKALNERTTGGIEIVRDSSPLPEDDPVAWRERNKKSLGKARYLFRFLIFIEAPTLFICAMAATISARSAFEGLYVLQTVIWTVAALIAAVKGATLFSSERAKQTIEPLLASPMTATELLEQKVAGMRRLIIVLATPVLTVNLTHFLLSTRFGSWTGFFLSLEPVIYIALLVGGAGLLHFRIRGNTQSSTRKLQAAGCCVAILLGGGKLLFGESDSVNPWMYMFLSIVSTFVLLYLIAWISTGIGLKVHSQTKAVLTAVGVLATWAVVPLVIWPMFGFTSPAREILLTLSPYSLIEANERYLSGTMVFGSSWNYSDDIGTNWWKYTIPLYFVLILAVRRLIRWIAPSLLNRLETPDPSWSGTPTTRVPVLGGSET